MKLYHRFRQGLGRFLCLAGDRLLNPDHLEKRGRKIWIDVGAHLGETTFQHAQRDPDLTVYAFEPNLQVAAKRVGVVPNFVVLPMAVAETDGCTDFYLNAYETASSTLPLNLLGLARWQGGDQLTVQRKISVPAIRLETFMNLMGIKQVDYLKVDAQGADLEVIKSLGSRLRDVERICLEVQVSEVPLYEGAAEKSNVVRYLSEAGFQLVATEKQSQDQEENLTFLRRVKAQDA